MRLYVDEEPLVLTESKLLRYERVLDMRTGIVERSARFRTARGAVVELRSQRLASLHWRHLAAISYEVTLVSGMAELAIASELVTHLPQPKGDDDPRVGVRMDESALAPVNQFCDDTRVLLELRTRSSGIGLACGMEHSIDTELRHSVESSVQEDEGRVVFFLDAEPGVPARVTKLLGYHHASQAPPGDLVRRVNRTLDRAAGDGFERIAEVQRERLDAFWEHSDIEIDGPEDIQQAVRFNLFQIRQASARVEGHGIAAKGLTGRGYEGQYFWDTEIYVLPVLTYTQPHVARRLLHFRYEMLDAARRRARQLGHRGALFPWRTISGEEASAYYAAGTAQYHINAAISYAVRQFVRVTGDEEFIAREGVEILVETARLWADLGFFSQRRDGQFCIQGVTGPDEYSAVVDNNAYTNLMARENLAAAAEGLDLLRDTDPDAYDRLVARLRIEPHEHAEWERAAEPDVRPLRRARRRAAAGRALPQPQAVGLRAHAAGQVPAAAALPPAEHLPPPGHQADRRRARDVPRRRPLLARREAARVRVLRPADDRRLVAVVVRAERHGGRGRRRAGGLRLLPAQRRGRPRQPRRQRLRRHPRRLLRRGLDGARQRLRRAARHRRLRPALHAAPAGRLEAHALPAHLPRQPPRGRDDGRTRRPTGCSTARR